MNKDERRALASLLFLARQEEVRKIEQWYKKGRFDDVDSQVVYDARKEYDALVELEKRLRA